MLREEEMARLDLEREERTGFPEVVFCEGKPDGVLPGICERLYEKHGTVLGTRASAGQYALVRESFAEKYGSAVAEKLVYDGISRILRFSGEDRPRTGRVAVVCAGTSDVPVAEEAAQTAEFFGTSCERFYDVGVSGLHRLLSVIDRIREANCVIAVAGMEGALVSVLGGLVRNPVIAVPTSVGYGVGAGGQAALHAMLSSCANGIAVVNIDNGYGAGYLATQINRLAAGDGGREER
ncbi:MAG: nickel pincer cofactor biosynthesis protein LarB [Lachnospiraceae bacterium]|nr:nickel pincer cofactor biosynthesis protein LarB [Lachnospiraceae bacterium]